MSVFDEKTVAIEAIVAEFESHWSVDNDGLIAKQLKEVDEELRSRVLWELVEADLELRLKAGAAARVESYAEQFPSLLDNPRRFGEFVFSEFRIRSRREFKVSIDSFTDRFPILETQLRSLAESHRGGGALSMTASRMPLTDGEGDKEVNDGSIGMATSRSGRFRLLEPHDEGGLGKVWIAYDCELNREVALKEIQSRYADDETSRIRFATEAMVTSGLEHPGVVPVYGFGHYNDGRPYYTMRFVRGTSFRSAIRRFHENSRKRKSVHSVEMRRLLNQFLDVCNTIHYAHQRGVLHRDLKPSNIMLGDYGETLVLDWGLAKTIDSEHDLDAPREEPSLRPRIAGLRTDGAETLLGKALGSPAYMSPEQARGEHDQLGSATDVYSLGATLYTMLTNQAPIQKGAQTQEMLTAVQRGDWPRPRAIKNSVPRALEAICLKAMALEPADRYESASALGQEVEQYLADEPVLAMPENVFRRTWRVVRRNDAIVGAIVLTLVTVAITSFGAALLLDEQRRMTEAFAQSESNYRRESLSAKAAAQKSFARAERYFDLIDNAFTLREGESGDDVTLLDGLRRAADRMEGESVDVGLMQLEFAKRFASLGAVEEARRFATSAVDLLQRSAGDLAPETREAWNVLADVMVEAGESAEALAARESIVQKLMASVPKDLANPAEPLVELAQWAFRHGMAQSAIEYQRRAIEQLRQSFGSNNLQTVQAEVVLARMLGADGRVSEAVSLLEPMLRKRSQPYDLPIVRTAADEVLREVTRQAETERNRPPTKEEVFISPSGEETDSGTGSSSAAAADSISEPDSNP